MKYNLLFGGKAGQGPNILADLVSKGLVEKGFYVFYSKEYQSLIRGGHNYNTVAFSDKPINSNFNEIDILIALDDLTKQLHQKNLKTQGILFEGNENNIFFAGALFKMLGLEFKNLEFNLRQLKNFEENLRTAKIGYNTEKRILPLQPIMSKKQLNFMSGSQGIAEGAVKSGLNVYYGYPMTPATPVLTELAQMQLIKSNTHLTVELEDEIAVVNSAIGSSIAGWKSMAGTSGGGFDLMTEAISLSGIAEIPLVIYFAQRASPSTGVPTGTGQGDFNAAIHGGHGEFPRVVLAPGDAKESAELTSQAFYLSQKFRIPAIILSDKHLAESKYTSDLQPNILQSEKSLTILKKLSSYEHDENGISTEDTKLIKKAVEIRFKKQAEIEKTASQFELFKIHGNKNSKNIIISWGSTKGAILDAIERSNIDAKFIQILYLEPFSRKLKEELQKSKKILVIENNFTSPLSQLIAKKTGIIIDDKNKILRYDSLPFLSDELSEEIKEKLR